GRKLFVGNLSFNTDERRLEEVFQAIGPVDSVNIVRDQMTGRARGFAFVEMQTEEGAKNAIDRLNETELDGRRIAVNEARPKPVGGGAGRSGAGTVPSGRRPRRRELVARSVRRGWTGSTVVARHAGPGARNRGCQDKRHGNGDESRGIGWRGVEEVRPRLAPSTIRTPNA